MRTRHTAPVAAADRPWFAKVKVGRRCEIRPYSRAGWLLTVAYAVAMLGMGLSLMTIEEPAPAVWISWIVISLAITFAFLLTAWRTSATVDACAPGRSGKGPNSQAQSIILSLLAAAGIIGAAFFGFDL
jgi:hypothetical protein